METRSIRLKSSLQSSKMTSNPTFRKKGSMQREGHGLGSLFAANINSAVGDIPQKWHLETTNGKNTTSDVVNPTLSNDNLDLF